jgi:CSLREA domain-containing protein
MLSPMLSRKRLKNTWRWGLVLSLCFALLGPALSARSRAFAASFSVNTTADGSDNNPGDGVCDVGTGDCSLRAAIEEVTMLHTLGIDTSTHTISVPAGEYILSLGELSLGANANITGAGSDLTIINANYASRVLSVGGITTSTLTGLALKNGQATSAAGIELITADLTLIDVVLRDNVATTQSGGGIFNNGGALALENVLVEGNSALLGGGGLYIYNSALAVITDTTIHDNHVTDPSGSGTGGGIHSSIDCDLTIVQSTISSNTAPVGGGLYNHSSTARLTNVTISSNQATTTLTSGGGAINNQGTGYLDLKSVTIYDNTTDTGRALINVATLNIAHTIVANNPGGDCTFSGSFDGAVHHNLDSDGTCFTGIPSNLVGTDPLVSPLANYGGPTKTHALHFDSPAIDAGDGINGCKSQGILLLEDQRGEARTVDGNQDVSSVCDIGAYEREAPIFNDVAWDHWARDYIEGIYHAGITSGCGGGAYCPMFAVSRAQMAKFLLVAEHGSGYTPPAGTGTMFGDVGPGHLFVDWIEQLANEGITSGCGGGNYCPDLPVSRAQMAKFLLIAEHGSGYTPPAGTGTMFLDVGPGHLFVDWIEQLASEGVTSGCGGGNYCPDFAVARDQMAVFLVRTFEIQIP